MKYMTGSITDIEEGIICQQVNCRNAYGRGVSGVLAKKWPAFEEDYRESFDNKTPEELFGDIGFVQLPSNGEKRKITLMGANLYTQFDYGNSEKTGIVYTDMAKLIECLRKISGLGKAMGLPVYVPYKIGCGLAGGDWTELVNGLDSLKTDNIDNITAVVLPSEKAPT